MARRLPVPKPYSNPNRHRVGRARVAPSRSPRTSTLRTLGGTTPSTMPCFPPSVCSPTAGAGPPPSQSIQSPEGMLNQMFSTAPGLTGISNYSPCPEPMVFEAFLPSAPTFNGAGFQLANTGVEYLQPGPFAVNTGQSLPAVGPQSPSRLPNFAPPRKKYMEDGEEVRMLIEGFNGERMHRIVRYRATHAESRVNKSWLDREKPSLEWVPPPPREGMGDYYMITIVGGERFDGPVRQRFNIQVAELDESEVHIDMGYKMAAKLGLVQGRSNMSNRVKTPMDQCDLAQSMCSDLSWTDFTGTPAQVPDWSGNSLDTLVPSGQRYPSTPLTLGAFTNELRHTPTPVVTPMGNPDQGLCDGLWDASFTQSMDPYVDDSTPPSNSFGFGFPDQY